MTCRQCATPKTGESAGAASTDYGSLVGVQGCSAALPLAALPLSQSAPIRTSPRSEVRAKNEKCGCQPDLCAEKCCGRVRSALQRQVPGLPGRRPHYNRPTEVNHVFFTAAPASSISKATHGWGGSLTPSPYAASPSLPTSAAGGTNPPAGSKTLAGRRSSGLARSLPTDRLNFEKQVDVLRAIAQMSGNSRRPVTAEDLSAAIGLKGNTGWSSATSSSETADGSSPLAVVCTPQASRSWSITGT